MMDLGMKLLAAIMLAACIYQIAKIGEEEEKK